MYIYIYIYIYISCTSRSRSAPDTRETADAAAASSCVRSWGSHYFISQNEVISNSKQ